MSGHDSSLLPYVLVLVALLVLTGLTIGAAYIHMGHFMHNLAAFTIAAIKASVVILFFMHVKGSTSLIKLSAVGGFFWLLIFFILLMSDVWTRTTLVPGWH